MLIGSMGGMGKMGKKKRVQKVCKTLRKVDKSDHKARTLLQKVCRNLTFLYFNIMLNCAG
jgi:hypothetical protein